MHRPTKFKYRDLEKAPSSLQISIKVRRKLPSTSPLNSSNEIWRKFPSTESTYSIKYKGLEKALKHQVNLKYQISKSGGSYQASDSLKVSSIRSGGSCQAPGPLEVSSVKVRRKLPST